MGVYQRDGRWMVFFHDHDGRRRDKSFGRGEMAELRAQVFDVGVKEALANNLPIPDPNQLTVPSDRHGPISSEESESNDAEDPEAERSQGIKLSELGTMYLDHMRASGRTDKHIRNIERLLENQFIPVIGDKPVDSLTYQGDMVPFILHFKGKSESTKKDRSQYTVNKYCDYLSFIFNFGINNNLTHVNPLLPWKKPKVQPYDLKLSLDDVKKIMVNAEPHLKWAMEVCFNLGTRPGESELLSLKWSDVDFVSETVKIYATKTKTYRTIPINPEFLERMKVMKLESKSGYVVEYMERKITTLRKAFKNACKRAGVDYQTRMYDLRHLFATTLLNNGADLAAVSKMLGHSTVKLTADTYYHYMEGEKERAVRLLPRLAVG